MKPSFYLLTIPTILLMAYIFIPQLRASDETLRQLATTAKIQIGTAVSVKALEDSQYCEVLKNEFNLVVAENAMKFKYLHPSKEVYDFSQGDRLVEFALKNGMAVHGHNLIWGADNPDWLIKGNFSRDELIAILKDHISTVVNHWKGTVTSWDVVNEAIANDGSRSESIWEKGIGPEYIAIAFTTAAATDPQAKLYYNDMSLGQKKSDATFAMLTDLVNQKVPIHGVGMEMHLSLDHNNKKLLAEDISRFAKLGLFISISELDVRIKTPATSESLLKQAELYSDILKMAIDSKVCERFTVWGFTDAYSWIPSHFPDFGAGLIYDEQYNKKPAYWSIVKGLKSP